MLLLWKFFFFWNYVYAMYLKSKRNYHQKWATNIFICSYNMQFCKEDIDIIIYEVCFFYEILWQNVIVGFFIHVSSLKVFSHSIHSERRRIYLGKSIQALQNDTLSYHDFSFRVIQSTLQWHTFKTFMFVFMNFLFITTAFQGSQLLPNQYRTHMTFSHKIQAKIFTWPDMSFYAR